MNKPTQRLKIAMFHNIPGGGAKRAIYHLCKEIKARGHHVDVYSTDASGDVRFPLRDLGITVHLYPIGLRPKHAELKPYLLERLALLWTDLFYMGKHKRLNKQMAKDINQSGYDLVWMDKCFVASSAFILQYLKIPTLYFCHEPYRYAFENFDDLEEKEKGLYGMIQKIYFSYRGYIDRENAGKASRLLANSIYSQGYIREAYHRDSNVCYLGVDPELFRPLDLVREKFVLSVGALWKAKRHELAIHAIGLIPQDIRPKFVIVTDSKWSVSRKGELEALAKKLEVNLEILVGVTDEKLVELYNRAAVVVYTAKREPFGLVAIEAMACGTPIVGVREGGLRESILDGETGFLARPTPQACAEAIQALLKNPELQKRFGKNGVRHVKEKWTWEISADHFEKHLYETAGFKSEAEKETACAVVA